MSNEVHRKRRSITIPASLVLGLALATAIPATPAIAATASISDNDLSPIFLLEKVDGETVKGELVRIENPLRIVLRDGDGKESAFASNEFVKLGRQGISSTFAIDPSAVVLFPEGDRLRTAVRSASETHLDVQSYLFGKLDVPLDAILGLVLSIPASSNAFDNDATDRLLDRVRNEPRTSEVVWLANGDKLTGGFLGFSEKEVELLVNKTPVKVNRSGVIALGFELSQVVYSSPKSDFLEFTFLDGSRLGLTDARLESDQLVGTSRFGVPIRVALSEVTAVHRRSDTIAYLADRSVAAEKYVNYIGKPRPYRKNLTVEGHVFRLSGQDFDRGIGTESRTLLAYRLEPGDRRFQALVGLDDRAGPLGSVVFKVIVDNKEKFKSPPMSMRDLPKSLDIDVEGGKILILITEFGERGNVRDIADWVEARLLR